MSKMLTRILRFDDRKPIFYTQDEFLDRFKETHRPWSLDFETRLSPFERSGPVWLSGGRQGAQKQQSVKGWKN